MVEGSVRNSFAHSFLTKGRLLYTHDPTIADLCATPARPRPARPAGAAAARRHHALPPIDKAHKWFVTRGDLDYTALWILYAATPLAQVEVIGAGQLVDREVIPQATAHQSRLLQDDLHRPAQCDRRRGRASAPHSTPWTPTSPTRATTVFGPVLDHLREVGEARSCREIEDHFKRNFDVSGVTTACEYLADQGLIGKASTAVRLTKKSNVDVQELAFYSSPEWPVAMKPATSSAKVHSAPARTDRSPCRARACTT